MTIIFPPLQGILLVYLLTFARAGAMIMLLPVIGDAGVPARVRLAFALAVSAALTTVTAKYYPTVPPPPMELTALIARESTAGVLVGTMARLIMSALEVAGFLIANQTGLAFAQTFDPSQGAQSAMVSTFLSLIGALLVFETGLHHVALGAIAGSYKLLPPNGVSRSRYGGVDAQRSPPAPLRLGCNWRRPFWSSAFCCMRRSASFRA